jgi:pyruvate-ferredoxin/flavodoxin oxidoreductase
MALTEYTGRELRYRSLARTHPAEAERLAELAQEEVDRRWATYEEMASHGADRFPGPGTDDPARPGAEEGTN